MLLHGEDSPLPAVRPASGPRPCPRSQLPPPARGLSAAVGAHCHLTLGIGAGRPKYLGKPFTPIPAPSSTLPLRQYEAHWSDHCHRRVCNSNQEPLSHSSPSQKRQLDPTSSPHLPLTRPPTRAQCTGPMPTLLRRCVPRNHGCSPRMRRASFMSLTVIVTRLAWMAQRLVSTKRPVRYASAASCNARTAVDWNRRPL